MSQSDDCKYRKKRISKYGCVILANEWKAKYPNMNEFSLHLHMKLFGLVQMYSNLIVRYIKWVDIWYNWIKCRNFSKNSTTILSNFIVKLWKIHYFQSRRRQVNNLMFFLAFLVLVRLDFNWKWASLAFRVIDKTHY